MSEEALARRLVSALAERGLTVATCESLTAGLLSATIASVPGASAVLRGGLVTYATELKAELAGVSSPLLAERGPVDGDVARQMAEGAARVCGASLGMSTTGVAGPDPVGDQGPGTVWIAVTEAEPRLLALSGDRQEIRRQTVAAALELALDTVTGSAGEPAPEPV